MKKFFTLLIMCCLLSINAIAQRPTPSFMGIPIEGSFYDFNAQLQAKGFTFDEEGDGGNVYLGKFLNENVVLTAIPGLDNQIAILGIYFPVEDTWDSATKTYDKYLKIYSNKYGTPDIKSKDSGNFIPGSDAFHSALEYGQIDYKDVYEVDNCYVTLSIQVATTTDTSDGYQVLILYINGDNYIDTVSTYEDDI